MTYGVGRHIDHNDMPAVRAVVRKAKAEGLSFESIVLGVVDSDAFRRRSAPVALPKTTTCDGGEHATQRAGAWVKKG